MSSSSLAATRLESYTEKAPAFEDTPLVDVTPAVVKEPAAEEEKIPSQEEKPSQKEEPSEKEKLLAADPTARIRRPSYILGVPDPKGVVLFMVIASLLYTLVTPWLLWRLADQATMLIWTASHLATSYTVMGTVCLSTMRFSTIFFRISYGELLSVAATHFIGTNSVAVVATLLAFYSAGMLGYAIADFLQRQEIEESIIEVLILSSRAREYQEPREESVWFFISMHGMTSFIIVLLMVSLVLHPA